MKILVLGANGLIGTNITHRLSTDGHAIAGLGRRVAQAARRYPDIEWISADIAAMRTPESWATILARVRPQAIVNSAGALQDGLRDNLGHVQEEAMQALYAAAEKAGVNLFVQISASRAAPDSSTRFMRTKGMADRALAGSALEWTILRPGLVLSPQAYGGTALLRALAATPWLQPAIAGAGAIQSVAAHDVADAVAAVIAGQVPARRIYDLVEDESHSLEETVVLMRQWLGLPPGRVAHVPAWLVWPVRRIADALGWLGWRSPMRSTAITELRAGVAGDPTAWRQASGKSLAPLQETLRAMPSTVQERWFARLFLFKPLTIAVLSSFWLVSGIVTLVDPDTAAAILRERQVSAFWAYAAAVGGAMLDILLGLAILVRAWMKAAALGMIGLTLAYLAGATLLAPDLWAHPLGPLVKTIPAMALALGALALADDR